MAGPAFIDRENFPEYLAKPYKDVGTVYGDMSRLVVGWLASTPPAELRATYLRAGWKDSPNVLPLHKAAKAWMAQHRKT